MSELKKQNVTDNIETLEILHPRTSANKHRDWLEAKLEVLKDDFELAEKPDQKIKLFKAIEDYTKSQEKDPLVLIKTLRELPDHKARALIAFLKKEDLLSDLKKTTTQKLFK